jgi:hypothetical protein
MSSPVNAQVTGSFVSDGNPLLISIPSGYSDFRMINLTDIGSAGATTPVMRAEGTSLMAAGSAYYNTKTNGAATLDLEITTTTGGFTFVPDSALLAIGPSTALNGTEVNRANPAVADTATTTNLVAGSTVVRMYGTTGMLQIAGWDFTIGTIVGSTSFQLKYLDNTGFAADATAGTFRIINAQDRYYPRVRLITAITQAAQAVITLSVTHGYTVGQEVRIVVPAAFGMTEINGLLGVIVAVTTGSTNTITVDIDSTSFTAFAFPTSAIAAAGVSFPQVVPVGEAAINSISQPFGNLLDDRTRNVSVTGVIVGATVQTADKRYQWFANKATSI